MVNLFLCFFLFSESNLWMLFANAKGCRTSKFGEHLLPKCSFAVFCSQSTPGELPLEYSSYNSKVSLILLFLYERFNCIIYQMTCMHGHIFIAEYSCHRPSKLGPQNLSVTCKIGLLA